MLELGTRTPLETDLDSPLSGQGGAYNNGGGTHLKVFKFLNSEDLGQPHPKFWAKGLWQGLRSLHCQIVNTED
jgi:hypothetical protein